MNGANGGVFVLIGITDFCECCIKFKTKGGAEGRGMDVHAERCSLLIIISL